MKMKYLIPVVFLVLAFNSNGYGQSKRIIQEKGIKSVTTQEYFLDQHKNKPVVERIETFNELGNLVEIKVFNSSENIKRWEKFVYDEDGNLIEKTFLDDKGRVERTEKSIYKYCLRVERHFFDDRERMYKKKVYVYEFKD